MTLNHQILDFSYKDVVGLNRILLPRYSQDLVFAKVKSHLPFLGPFSNFCQIRLQFGSIIITLNSAVNQIIISEKTLFSRFLLFFVCSLLYFNFVFIYRSGNFSDVKLYKPRRYCVLKAKCFKRQIGGKWHYANQKLL